MIHVNARAIIVKIAHGEMQIVIQKRKRKGEPEYYELPGGRIEEYESLTDAHWVTISEIKHLIDSGRFSDIDKAAVMLYIQDRIKSDMT